MENRKKLEEKLREDLSKDKVEITAADLAEKSAKVLSKEPLKDIVEANPVLLLAFAIFSTELTAEIFNFGGRKEESEAE